MFSQKANFQIGNKEKHNVSLEINSWWGGFFVTVDGNKTSINGKSMVGGPFSIEVGEKEKHTLTFQIMLPAVFPAFRRKSVQVLVDGKIFKTFD